MKMIRNFLPVGHGAFYHEQFSDENSKANINIIYDCGSKSKSKAEIHDIIEHTFNKNETIHAIFISHFHTDHFNGLEFLLDHCDVRNIFIPAILEEDKSLLHLANLINSNKLSNFEKNFIINPRETILQKSKCNIYEIKPLEIPKHLINDFTIDYRLDMVINNLNIESGKNVSSIISDTKILDDWLYILYNYPEKPENLEKLRQELQEFANNKKTALEDLPQNITQKELDEIKNIYLQTLGSTHFNTNSMVVFSGVSPKNNYYSQFLSKKEFISYFNNHQSPKYKPSCLYTGDINLSGEKYSLLKKCYSCYINENFWDTLGCIQIPHHGSINNFNNELCENDCIFIISADLQTHPHPGVTNELKLRNCLYFIAANSHTIPVSFSIGTPTETIYLDNGNVLLEKKPCTKCYDEKSEKKYFNYNVAIIYQDHLNDKTKTEIINKTKDINIDSFTICCHSTFSCPEWEFFKNTVEDWRNSYF